MIWIVVGFITTPILWIWGIVDAYHKAQKINSQAGGVAPF